MKKKNGFTLIELLAVIIILGILMIIAIPSVTKYINDSRKDVYVDTAKEIVSGTRSLVNEGNLEMYDTNTTYYIPAKYINTENALKSPYGDFTEAYVGVTYDGNGYNYYWISVDDSGQGVKDITNIDKLDINDIESDLSSDDIESKVKTTGIGTRTSIKVLNPETNNWDPYTVEDITKNVLENGNKLVTITYPEGKTRDTVVRGDIISIGAERFYVVKRDGNDLILIAEYNLKIGWIYTNGSRTGEYTSIDDGYGMQSSETIGQVNNSRSFKGTMTFAKTNYWKDRTPNYPIELLENEGNLKKYVDLYISNLGINVKGARLLTYNEALELGCNASTRNCQGVSFLYKTSFWLETVDSDMGVWSISNFSSYGFLSNNDYRSAHAGVRPVIII